MCISVLKVAPSSVSLWKVLLPVAVISSALLTAIWLYRHSKKGYGHMDIAEVHARRSGRGLVTSDSITDGLETN